MTSTNTVNTFDPVVAHRVDFWTWVACHSIEPERGRLLRLRDHWMSANDRWFAGAMTLPYITLTEPSAPNTFGQCCSVSSWGSRLEIRIRPSLIAGTHPHLRDPAEGRWRFVLDVLLHETVHQYHREITGKTEPSYHGHGPAFAEVANRIGVDLGVPPVVARKRGDTDQPRAAQWPHNVRGPAYYLGAYQPPARNTAPTSPCPHCHGTGHIPD